MISVVCAIVSAPSQNTAKLMSDARVAAPSPSCQSCFNARSIFPISTGSPWVKLVIVSAIKGTAVTPRQMNRKSKIENRKSHSLLQVRPSRSINSSASFGPQEPEG